MTQDLILNFLCSPGSLNSLPTPLSFQLLQYRLGWLCQTLNYPTNFNDPRLQNDNYNNVMDLTRRNDATPSSEIFTSIFIYRILRVDRFYASLIILKSNRSIKFRYQATVAMLLILETQSKVARSLAATSIHKSCLLNTISFRSRA
jgi:hypothetical protein